MKILLTNDDGIDAPGIGALFDAFTDAHGDFGSPLGDLVWPIAPLTVQSATGHGVTFHQPLMTRDRTVNDRMRGVAVDGRPADCVKLALANLWPERFGDGARPDLLVSGMNAGANCGVNVIYSGTVAAAIEAAFLGVPAIAVSLHIGGGAPDFRTAARHARVAVEAVLEGARGGRASGAGVALAPHSCININLPITERPGPTPEMEVCPMNTHGLVDKFEARRNPAGERYFWAAGHGLDFHARDAGTDVDALFRRRIAITPLMYDLTEARTMEQWRKWLAAAPAAAR